MVLGYVSLLQRDTVGLTALKGHHDNTNHYEYKRIHTLGYSAQASLTQSVAR